MNTMRVIVRPLADAKPALDEPNPIAPPIVFPADDPINYAPRWRRFLAIPDDC